ncbi:class I SAM-dependent methyltransferase [Rhizobium sp. BK251]|uniref:class I SAM-dependent methyltransferase n=1 Tax=Rhizobium sp. BK251 TaxID=2512125 RepID=UPI00104BE688|nr:class I SAM-dependent methyltransferase [Rhizobium sp. BK251]TCL70399.1 ubiquinone/menaquinone biosynthesis C-methylase UbiE [Rhizobium sp. BK251]
MNESEFDQFADEYRALHANAIAASGETPEFFADYKIADMVRHVRNRNVSAEKILDFGCGVGTSTPYFLKYFPDTQVVGVDVSRKSLEIAASRFGSKAQYSLLENDAIRFPANTFDVAFAACVFHHISWDEHDHWLREMWRVVKPNGIVTIFEHNPWNPLTLHAVNTCEFDANAKLMNPFRLRAVLKAAGFRSITHEYRIFFPNMLKSLRPLERGMGWLPLGAQYSVTAQK